MTNIRLNRLQAKVQAVNLARAYAAELSAALRPVFEPLVGQQVLKADGSLLQKVEKLLPPIANGSDVKAHFSTSSRYSLTWKVTGHACVDQSVCYHEEVVYIGELTGAHLEKLNAPYTARANFTVQEILEKREIAEKAKQAYEAAVSNLHPFSESDR